MLYSFTYETRIDFIVLYIYINVRNLYAYWFSLTSTSLHHASEEDNPQTDHEDHGHEEVKAIFRKWGTTGNRLPHKGLRERSVILKISIN